MGKLKRQQSPKIFVGVLKYDVTSITLAIYVVENLSIKG